jgi:hypothetical protein
MRVVLRVQGNPWWIRQLDVANPVVELSPEEQLRKLVNAALATPYFSKPERLEALLRARTLADLPLVPAREVLTGRSRFLNPKIKTARGLLRLPFASDSCVLIGKDLRVPKGVTVVDEGMLGRLHLGETRMLAATPAVLRRICAQIEARSLALPRLSEAVVVLQGVEDGLLGEGERDMLWRCLGVPIFEQWLGLDGEVLAWECGAHQGLHWMRERAELEQVNGELVVTSWPALRTPVARLATGFCAELGSAVCLCGDQRPLLRKLRGKQIPVAEEVAMAASA